MSENQDSSAASAAVAQPGTTQQSQSSQSPQQSQDSPSATGAQATAAAAAAAVVVNIGNTGENLVCQWQGCQERCPSAEALYEHVCERHVGRKSTNNLNLTCRWGNCTTTTVKRDHITSHIRVHVPLKPHKCEFCGKAFKRPQDLKKHVKTHADDSVLVRSPEPSNGAAPRPNVMFGMPNGGKAHYFENPLTSANQGYGDYAAPPYHPQGQHGPQPSAAYGNVYYALNGGDASHASIESRKRGYEALNEFFGDLKRRNFDASSYHAIGNRLNSLNLHGLQLPTLNGGVVPEYHAVPAMVNVGGGSPGGYHGGPMPAQPYHLPPMGNLRTKSDLMNIDQFLEQMQSTVYESDDHVAAAGIAQPGAHYVQGGMSYRTSNSPPTATQLPRTMASGTPSVPVPANTSSAHSPHSGTPALTPPSSAQSYTSGRSPQSIHSGHNYQHTSAAIYPTLPATSGQDHPSTGYPTSSGAPASTLSGIFDNDDRRRYTGGMLQRSRPAERHDDVEMDETTASPKQADRDRFHDSLVDPALSQPTGSPSDEKQRSATPDAKATNLATAEAAEAADRAEEQWVEHVRFIENLRKYISERLEAGDYEDEQRLRRQEVLEEEGQMEGVETTAAASPRKEPASLYPVLRGLDDDNDAKMTEDS